MVFLIVLAGHFGGSITHGSDYLTRAFSAEASGQAEEKRKPIPNVQQAMAYQDVIKPILTSKCYKCHGPNKQKGKLRLDMPDFILKGGKGGKAIIAGNTDESELIKRILLSKESDDHMPPLEQPQLTKTELDLIHWWVSSGADFNKKVADLAQTEKIKPVLLSLQSEEKTEAALISDIPEKTVGQADAKIVQELLARGVAVIPVALNSNYLSVNFVALDSITAKDLQLLEQLSKQVIWLKIGDSNLDDNNLKSIVKLSSLTRLSIEKTAVSDAGIALLNGLPKLTYLNLVGTKLTAKGLTQLKSLKDLRQIFLYQTAISGAEFSQLSKLFPKALIDTGGYKLQFLESDTVELKSARLK
jgi:mono/diheme cytochrome c family protein